jgi:hypothetical protein
MAMANGGKKKVHTLYCSFCHKSQHDIDALIAGPAVFICNECVKLCDEILANVPKRDKNAPPPEIKGSDTLPTPQILKLLKAQEVTCESTREQLQHSIDILREREVSWAAIGEALGITRQAAWERFS